MKNPLILFTALVLLIAGLGTLWFVREFRSRTDFSNEVSSGEERTQRLVKYEIENAEERGALCNDGSPAVFYYQAGFGDNADKWIIHLQGGGWCSSEEECLDRWQTQRHLMSSKNYPDVSPSSGIMSPDSKKNPDFYNYNHVRMQYCSSDLWAGNGIWEIGGYDVQFNGSKIFDAVLEDLQNRDLPGSSLKDATHVLLTGSSAGGSGVMNNLDHTADLLFWAEVKGVNDSAWNMTNLIVPEEYSEEETAERQVQFTSINPRMDASCVEASVTSPANCLNSSSMYTSIETPFFLYIDQQDHKFLGDVGIDNPNDPEEFALMEQNAANIRASIADLDGVFSTRNGTHTALTSDKFFTMEVNGHTYQEVFTNWYFGKDGLSYVVLP